jgi:hypothetical protein
MQSTMSFKLIFYLFTQAQKTNEQFYFTLVMFYRTGRDFQELISSTITTSE